MSGMLRAGLMALLVLMPLAGAAQHATNFSGDWVLVSATTSGTRGRGEAETSKPGSGTRTMTNTASGAAFNCGRECSIAHKGQTLTIEKALLASNTAAAPAVSLRLDGRQAPVVDSFNPGREIPATAKWVGDKLEITSSLGAGAFTQQLSIEGVELVVVTSVSYQGSSPVTSRYRRR